MPTPVDAAPHIAEAFHESYETLAPLFDYRTRTKSAVEWQNVPDNNRRLMIAVVVDLIRRRVIVPGEDEIAAAPVQRNG